MTNKAPPAATPLLAEKLLRGNFISLAEARKIFPCNIDNPANYDEIPYSPELLYNCSEPNNTQFILFPGLVKCGNGPLAIYNLYHLLSPRYDFFGPWDKISQFKPKFAIATCLPRWYLLSKTVLSQEKLRQFCDKHEYSYRDFEIDRVIVYVYAWLLFYFARKEKIFGEDWVQCIDDFYRGALTKLAFQRDKIFIEDWRPAILPRPSIVASVEPYLPNSFTENDLQK